MANNRKKKTAPPRGERRLAPSARGATSAAKDAAAPVKQRVQALAEMAGYVAADEKSCRAAIDLLVDAGQPSPVRLAALQALQSASFSVIEFEACKPAYVSALRKLMADPDLELRQRVLGILSREKDPEAQKRLLEGLRSPGVALVPPQKALQFLAYDIHTEAYDAAREIVENPPSPEAKREAVRLLASDSSAGPLLEKVLRDKDEYAEVRQVSAAALNTIDPEALRRNAREILLDEKDYPEIQATSLTALSQFGGAETTDPALRRRVRSLRESKSELVKESARAFTRKYGE